MQRRGVKSCQAVWTRLQRRAASSSSKRRGRPAQAPLVTELIQELHGRSAAPTQRSLTEVVQALEASAARPADYGTAVTALTSTKRWNQALCMLEVLEDAGMHQAKFLAESALLSSLDRGDLWHVALSYLDGIKSEGGDMRLTTVGYRAAVRVYMQAGRKGEAETCLEELVKQGTPRSLSAYNATMSACQTLHRWQVAVQYFDDMQASYLIPDMISWNTLISNCSSALEWRWSVQLLHEMQWNWLKPDDASFGSVLGALSAARSSSAVSTLLKSMRRDEVVPSNRGYTSAIRACIDATSKSEEPFVAWEVLDDTVRKGVVLGAGGYAMLLSAAAAWRRWEKVVWLVRQMQGNGSISQLHAASKNIASRACLEAGAWKEAMEIAQLSPMDRGGYNISVHAAADGSAWIHALEAFFDMQRAKILPTEAACGVVMELAGKASRWQASLQVLAFMQTEDELTPNTLTYNAAMSACKRSQEGASVLALLSDMEERTVSPDKYSYTTAIASLQASADWERALCLLSQMQRQELQADVATWSALVTVRCEAAPLDHMLKLLNAMTEASIKQEVLVFKSAIAACRTNWQETVGLLLEVHRRRIRLDSTTYTDTMQSMDCRPMV